jgi:hypothetical protein
MKLTKGKISKLYNKKKQTMKRKVNKKKSSNKNRTFRRKQKVNLARKSLKRLRYNKLSGGIGTDGVPKSEEDPGIFPPVVTEEANVTAPVVDAVTDLNVPPTEDLNVPPTEDLNAAPTEDLNAVPPEDLNAVPNQDLNAVPTEDLNAIPNEDLNAVPTEDLNAVPTEEDANVPITEEDANVPITEDVNIEPTEEDANVPTNEENVDVEPTDADLLAQENAAQEYNETNTEKPSIETKITDLVETIANETAKKIEEKLTDTEQNPADAVMGVANRFGNETAPAAGGKKRRTRKFRLLKKQNRTKRT